MSVDEVSVNLRPFFERHGWQWPPSDQRLFVTIQSLLIAGREFRNRRFQIEERSYILDGIDYEILQLSKGILTAKLRSTNGVVFKIRKEQFYRGIVRLPDGSLIELFTQNWLIEPHISKSSTGIPLKLSEFSVMEVIETNSLQAVR